MVIGMPQNLRVVVKLNFCFKPLEQECCKLARRGSHNGPERVCIAQSGKLAEQQPSHKELHIASCGART